MTNASGHGVLVDAGALLARVLLGALFVWAGYGKAMAASGTIAYFGSLGLPLPPVAYAVTVAVELVGGLMFITGFLFRPVALVLALWCIATGLVAHSDFADRNMLIHFYKNVAMCGGFIYAALLGPGRISIDAVLKAARGTR